MHTHRVLVLPLALPILACAGGGRESASEGATAASTTQAATSAASTSGVSTELTTGASQTTGTSQTLSGGLSDASATSTDASGSSTTCAGPDCPSCQEGETRCTGEISEICEGGTWQELETCDPVQGLSCGQSGVCQGECAAAKLGQSYIGCDFYPTVTSQHDDYNHDPHVFAVTIANTTADPAEVTITRGDLPVAMVTVAPGSVEALTLPWVPELSAGLGPSVLLPDGAYRLRSDRPVTVYQYNPFAATVSNDASLLIPVNAWGKRIVVASSTEAFDYPSFYAGCGSFWATRKLTILRGSAQVSWRRGPLRGTHGLQDLNTRPPKRKARPDGSTETRPAQAPF